jgi:mycoredoxin
LCLAQLVTQEIHVSVEAVHYYWRPGCPFCSMLRRGLDKLGVETIDHNIWDDPDAAAVVRSHTGGSETVPTVVIDGVGMVNPSAKQVAEHLERVAPHLLPDGYEPSTPGLLTRLLGS